MAIVRDLSGNVPNNAGAIDAHYDKDAVVYSLISLKATFAAGEVTVPISVTGGAYIWDYRATNWNGGSLILEVLTADGTTYDTVATVTASGKQGVVLGQNAVVRLRGVTATVSNLSSSLS